MVRHKSALQQMSWWGKDNRMPLASSSPRPVGRMLSRETVAGLLVTALAFQARLWCFRGEMGLRVPGITQRAGFGDWCVCDDFALLPLH